MEKSSSIQEIIQRYAIGTLHTVERTLTHTHGMAITTTLFELREAISQLIDQMQAEQMPIRTLDAISMELLNTIQVCVNASILGKNNIETKQ